MTVYQSPSAPPTVLVESAGERDLSPLSPAAALLERDR